MVEVLNHNEVETLNRDELSAMYEATFVDLQPGSIVKGIVVKVDHNEVLVDVGGKSEGIVPLKELSNVPMNSAIGSVEIGEEVELFVLREENEDGQVTLSKKRVDQARGWLFAQSDHEQNRIIRGKVIGVVKGGLLVEIHKIRGFVPASQLRLQSEKLEDLIGAELPLKIIEIDQRRNKLILSHRKALEDERSALRAEVVSGLNEGDIITGKIVRLVDFGAFIDVGGIDGLLPISEISWKRILHPNEVLKVGEDVTVKVFKIDRDLNRISLSLKQLQEDPWEKIAASIVEGDKIKGKVTKLANFGAFIEITEGIEALLPASEIEDESKKIEEILHVGDEIEVIVRRIKPSERKISVSLKEQKESEPTEEKAEESGEDKSMQNEE